MSDNIASLQIRIESLEVAAAERRLSALQRQGGKTERATNGLTSSFAKAAGAVAAMAAGVALVSKGVSSFSNLEKLNNQLVTATGSVEAATLQFESLNVFAASTPFVMDEVVTSFIKLKNLGLDPSQEALISYGNTASAMGKSLDQLIEAVADASVGEFERLKEFGIKAKSEGDNVSFTFQGVTTTVKKSSNEIQSYVKKIGDVQFAGSMDRQTDSIAVAFSNLGAASDRLAAKLADDSGLVDASKAASRALTDLFNSITGLPRSVSLVEEEIDRLTIALELASSPRMGQGISNQLKELREELQLSRSISTDTDEIEKAVTKLDEQIERYQSAINKHAEVPAKKVEKKGVMQSNSVYEQYELSTAKLEELTKEREALVSRIGSLKSKEEDATSGSGGDPEKATSDIDKLIVSLRTQSETLGLVGRDLGLYKASILEANASQLDTVNALYDVIEAHDAKIKAEKEATAASKESTRQSELQTKELEIQAELRRQEYQDLVESLRTEEEAVTASYDRRLELILENTKKNETQKHDLIARLDKEFASQVLEDFEAPSASSDEISILENTYHKKLALVREKHGEMSDLEIELTRKKELKIAEIEQQAQQQRLGYASDFFGNIAQVAEASSGEQSKTFKAAAIAQTTIKTYESATSAYAALAPIPYVGPALGIAAAGAAVASGMANVQAIRGIAHGGMTNVPDEATYLLQKGERVLSPNQNKDFTSFINNGSSSDAQSGSSNVSIQIINQASSDGYTATSTETTNENGKLVQIIIEKTKKSIAADIKNGGTSINSALKSTYGLKRS